MYKNMKKTLYLFIFLLCSYYLYIEYQKSSVNFSEILLNNFPKILLATFLYLFYLNFLNLRFFFFLKKITLYTANFFDWSKIFFTSTFMNITIFGSGHLMRIIHLKKKKVGINDYSVMLVILSILTLITYLFCFFFELLILTSEIFYFMLIMALFLIILIFSIFNLFLNRILSALKFQNYFFKKLKFFYSELNTILKNKFFLLKLITITIFIHLFDLIVFLLISSILISNENFFNLFILFFLYFILNKIPIFSTIPGINEIIIGYFGASLGFYFFESAMINLFIRGFLYTNVILSYIFTTIVSRFMKIRI